MRDWNYKDKMKIMTNIEGGSSGCLVGIGKTMLADIHYLLYIILKWFLFLNGFLVTQGETQDVLISEVL